MKIISFSPFGYEGELVTVEVDLRRGIPAVDLVGLADSAVKEARERMRAAIRNSDLEFPSERVLISLSPADVKKEGAGFDLAIALAVLQAANGHGENDFNESILVMGELELSGKLRGVRGINAAVATGAQKGIKHCIVPIQNQNEAEGLDFMEVHAVETLRQAFDVLNAINNDSKTSIKKINFSTDYLSANNEAEFDSVPLELDMSQIIGQPKLVRGLQIAAAGFHNVIAYGPPGCGKSLALQRFPSLLPLLSKEEASIVTRIHSLAGLLPQGTSLMKSAPFRIPHQSASLQGVIGGGINCLPGEISLAHGGVLFLDEAAEFRTSVLQSLRVPLENGSVTISRAGRHTVFPAQFQLLVATNPCPCGNYGAKDKICLCSAKSVEQYWKKFSAPLLDRIDIRIPVDIPDGTKNTSTPISSKELQEAIGKAVSIQRSRQGKRNALLTPEEIHYFCKLDQDCEEFLSKESQFYGFSTRALHSCIKLARTLADMEGSFNIRIKDLEEAIFYRKNEGGIDILF